MKHVMFLKFGDTNMLTLMKNFSLVSKGFYSIFKYTIGLKEISANFNLDPLWINQCGSNCFLFYSFAAYEKYEYNLAISIHEN